MFLDPFKKLFQSKPAVPPLDREAPVPVEHQEADHVADDRPRGGKLKPEAFAAIRAALIEVCRPHGKVGPDDTPIGSAIDFYVVEEPLGNERYVFIEVGSAQALTENWLRDLMDGLCWFASWGVGVGVGEARLFVFPDRIVGAGPTFRDVATIDEVIERSRRLLDMERLINTCRNDADLERLAQIPGIAGVRLRLSNLVDVTDEGSKHLAALKGLMALRLGRQVSDEGLANLRELVALEELVLAGTHISDNGLEHLQGLEKLRELWLNDTAIGDEGLASLSGLSELRELTLNNTKITDAGLGHLNGLPLRRLAVAGTTVSDSGLDHLEPLAGTLEELTLGATEVTDQGLKRIARLPKLRALDLSHTRITDAGLRTLYQLEELERVDVMDTYVTEQGVAELHGALVTLGQVDAQRTPSEQYRRAAVAVERLGAIVRLDQAGDGAPGAATSIHLEAFWAGGNERLSLLKELKPVRYLSIERAEIGSEGLKHLQSLETLEGLSITGVSIGAEGLGFLEPLAKLNRIFLEQMTLDADMIGKLAAVSGLTWLGLKGSKLDDGVVGTLPRLKQLKRLDLTGTGVDVTAVETLQRALPECEIAGP